VGSLKSPMAPTRGASPSDLAEIIHSRAWSRLQEIVQRLNILVELVDEGLTPLLPPFDGRPASAVRRLRVRLDDESLHDAIRRSMQTLTARWVTLAGVRILCVPIPRERGGAAGVLLLAGERTRGPAGELGFHRIIRPFPAFLALQTPQSDSRDRIGT